MNGKADAELIGLVRSIPLGNTMSHNEGLIKGHKTHVAEESVRADAGEVQIRDKLKNIYDKFNQPSPHKLYLIAKANDIKVTQKQVNEFVKSQKTTQVHKPVRDIKKNYIPIVTENSKEEYQIDLLDMTKFARKGNHNNKWIFIMVDVFSRKAFARPLKTKRPVETADALREIIDEEIKYIPRRIYSDMGSEYKGVFEKLLKENNILHNEAKDDHHALGVIDRFSKTLKDIIYKQFTINDNLEWVDKLPETIKNYNDTPHSSVDNQSPNQAEKNITRTRHSHFLRTQKHKTIEFKIGDSVRTQLKRSAFEKGSTKKWSDNVYIIVDKVKHNYILSDGRNLRYNQLQKVDGIPDVTIDKPIDKVKQATAERKQKNLLKRELDLDIEEVEFKKERPKRRIIKKSENLKYFPKG